MPDFDFRKYIYTNPLLNEEVNEAVINPEVQKMVNKLIKRMAQTYGYEEKDAVYAIKQAISNWEKN